MRLKILSYNIHKGFSATNKKFVLHSIKQAIQLVGADLVLLQEVIGHNDTYASTVTEWPTASQFEFLADQTWPHFAYGRNAVYEAGHHGNAILSKYPIDSWENINISTNVFENRGLLQATIPLPNCAIPLLCICVHLSLFGKGRQRQLEQICSAIQNHGAGKGPVIVGGDFNDWRSQASSTFRSDLREVFQFLYGHHARTFPALLPILRLDRIYFKDILPQTAQVLRGEPWDILSDHLAICAEVEIK